MKRTLNLNKEIRNTRDGFHLNSKSSLFAWTVTGFCDAESSFNINLIKNSSSLGYQTSLRFLIGLDRNDLPLLKEIQSFFKVGSIDISNSLAMFRVSKIDELINVIIPHFDKYPLLTQKKADFLLFKQAVEVVRNKEHFNQTGLNTILRLKATINLGLSDKLSIEYPNIEPLF